MNLIQFHTRQSIKTTKAWIPDHVVREKFGSHRCYYTSSNGYVMKEANGMFVREHRAKDGTLGYVLRNPIDGQNWLWLINRQDKKPHAVHPIH